MSNNKQSSIEWFHDAVNDIIANKRPCNSNEVAKILLEAQAMHKDEHSNTWDDSVDNYKKRGENDMRHWVDFDEYYKDKFQ